MANQPPQDNQPPIDDLIDTPIVISDDNPPEPAPTVDDLIGPPKEISDGNAPAPPHNAAGPPASAPNDAA